MGSSYTPKYITDEKSILTAEQKEAFDKEFAETSGSQASYEQIITGLMQKKNISTAEASELTGLNERLFKNLYKDEGRAEKRFIISIAVGFKLDVHLTEYILESCGMTFRESCKVDKAYIYLLESCKGKDISYCNAILRDLGIEGKDMLGELSRCGGEYRKRSNTPKGTV